MVPGPIPSTRPSISRRRSALPSLPGYRSGSAAASSLLRMARYGAGVMSIGRGVGSLSIRPSMLRSAAAPFSPEMSGCIIPPTEAAALITIPAPAHVLVAGSLPVAVPAGGRRHLRGVSRDTVRSARHTHTAAAWVGLIPVTGRDTSRSEERPMAAVGLAGAAGLKEG